MSSRDESTLKLREALDRLPPTVWLRDELQKALEDRNLDCSLAAFYRRYFDALLDSFAHHTDAELVDTLSSRMLRSEQVVMAHHEGQRDHLRHTIHDFLFGYLILNSTDFFEPIARDLARKLGNKPGEGMSCVNRAWFLAAHFHDLGYAVELHNHLMEFVRELSAELRHVSKVGAGYRVGYGSDAPLASIYAWRASLYGAPELAHVLPAESARKQLARPDHGLTAAFFLWERAEGDGPGTNRPSTPGMFDPAALRLAALACASHNFQYYAKTSPWFRISLSRDPVSFLLALVDEAQDWSRERLDQDLLWESGARPHKHGQVSLSTPPSVKRDGTGDLAVRYTVRVHPLLDDPKEEIQKRRARSDLEGSLFKRSRSLHDVLEMDERLPAISLEGTYHVVLGDPPLEIPCSVALALGKPRSEQVYSFPEQRPVIAPPFARAWAHQPPPVRDGARRPIRGTRDLGAAAPAPPDIRLQLEEDGTVPTVKLEDGKYLLQGDGGVGKSTLLQCLCAKPPLGLAVRYCEVLPEERRELSLDPIPGGRTVYLIDHFDHVLARDDAQFWKATISKLDLSPGVSLLLACRTEAAEKWAFRESCPSMRELEVERSGYPGQGPEDFARGKIGGLRDNLRSLASRLAFNAKGKRWLPRPQGQVDLVARSDGLLRLVGEQVRFFHDHVQDALAALYVLQHVREDGFQPMDKILLEQPPWVFAFLLLSLCDQQRGVSPLLGVGPHAFFAIRRAALDGMLKSSRALQWLEQTNANEVGPDPLREGLRPIEQLEKAVSGGAQGVEPMHVDLIRELTARLRQKDLLRHRPTEDNEDSAVERVKLAIRYQDLDTEANAHFPPAPFVPAHWWIRRRRNNLIARAFIWSRQFKRAADMADGFRDWARDWDEEFEKTKTLDVPSEVKDYWLAIHLGHRALVDLEQLVGEKIDLPTERTSAITRLSKGLGLIREGIFRRRRAMHQATPQSPDGYATHAQGLGDMAALYNDFVKKAWKMMRVLQEDPLGLFQQTIEFHTKIEGLWNQARDTRQDGEALTRFYPVCVDSAFYSAAVRAARENPSRAFHEVESAAEAAFKKWLEPYPYESTKDEAFEGARRRQLLTELLGTIRDLEGPLRKDGQRWQVS